MTVLDRMHKRQTEVIRKELTAGESEAGLSSIPEVKSAVVIRLQAVLKTLNQFVQTNGDAQTARFSFIMEAITEEVVEELEEKDDETIGFFMAQMGEVIAWVGHGDNSRLPANLREFAESINPSEKVLT
jgi:hypothetical protein